MKLSFDLSNLTLLLLLSSHTQNVIAHPTTDLAVAPLDPRDATPRSEDVFVASSDLYKRKGGGGGGGKGGGGGSSSGSGGKGGSGSSSSGSSGSSSSGSSSSSSSSRGGGSSSSSSNSGSSSGGRGSSTSNSGGATRQGSGVAPAFGGGRYYGGGSTRPYSAGARSPLGIAPFFFLGGALLFWPGIWLYGAYQYPYNHNYTFHNRTARRNATNTTSTPTRNVLLPTWLIERQATDDGVNETKPVQCYCAAYAECGCDDDGNSTFLDAVIGDGDYFKLNQSLVTVADVNGTSTILINGTLPNGTTASGGTEDANAAFRGIAQMSGYWVMVALVGGMVYLM